MEFLDSAMKLYILAATYFFASALAVRSSQPVQYTITRRGGSFLSQEEERLPYLLKQLQIVEARYNHTTVYSNNDIEREIEGDTKSIRKPRYGYGTEANTELMGEVGRDGNWFPTLELGEPAQSVDMDLDMLTADFLMWSTTSGKGSWFLDFKSPTYGTDPASSDDP